MRRKFFELTLSTMLLTLSTSVQAQQPAGTAARIASLSTAALSSLSPRLDAFRQGLRELGYVEGKNIVIEYRSAEGNINRLPELATELVRLKVDCIVTAGENPTRAAKQATSTIPIIMTTVGDPVGLGFVVSLAQPGGNITGLSTYSADLAGKRLELLKETILSFLVSPFSGYAGPRLKLRKLKARPGCKKYSSYLWRCKVLTSWKTHSDPALRVVQVLLS
jgi:putative tryptophan/tyrosine transport system substrate-binding protein